MDGNLSALPEGEEESKAPRRGGRGSARSATRSDEAAAGPKRERKEKIKTENAARKSEPAEAAPPARAEARPERSRHEKAERRHSRHSDEDVVVGFGDDMPAFMRIAAKI